MWELVGVADIQLGDIYTHENAHYWLAFQIEEDRILCLPYPTIGHPTWTSRVGTVHVWRGTGEPS
jgi:hypothetical protein